MDPELRTRAEARLVAAADAAGIDDPRPSYREKLKQLRQERPDAFDGAVEHYEEKVLPALADGDPLSVWVEYGRYLAGLSAEGRAVSVDAQGRATPWSVDAAAMSTAARHRAMPSPDGVAAVDTGARDRSTPGPVDAAPGLVLFIPEDTAADVTVLCRPLRLSDAQQATLTLLVDRKLALPG